MGFLSFVRRPKAPNPEPPSGYAAPTRSRKQLAEEIAAQTRLAKEVEACADLLRELYSLDLAIWGMQDDIDSSTREEKMIEANALFVKIYKIIQSWREVEGHKWSSAERRQIEEIASFLDRHDRKRYEI